jgi:type VI secretion system protein ImpL
MKQPLSGVLTGLPKLLRPGVLAVVLIAISVIAALVAIWPILPLWAWLLCVAALVLALLVWGIVKGVPWYRQQRFLRAHDSVVAGSGAAPAKALEDRLRAACNVILESPTLSAGRDPLYRKPWFLVLAADDADARAVLRPPLADSPFPEPEAAEGLVWTWWIYNGLIAVQLPSTYVCDAEQTDTRAVWYQALRLLVQNRPKLPANGIVVVVGAAMLMGPVEVLRETSTRLRRLVDEALRLLQIRAPVYLVVAGCDALPGFGAFADSLPAPVRKQAVGHRFTDRNAAGGAFQSWLEAGFHELGRTLHAIRLGLLGTTTDARVRRLVFGFVEAFTPLKEGLRQAGAILFGDNPYQLRPWLGGIFFTSKQAFSGDVFERFLPRDQPLARKTRRSRVLSWAGALGVSGLLLAGSAFLVAWIVTTSRDVERLAAAAERICAMPPERAQAVAVLTACREAIEAFSTAEPRGRFGFGLGSLSGVERALKGRYTAAYEAAIIGPLDHAFDRALQRRTLEFADHLALARRLALLRQRLAGREPDVTDALPVFEATVAAAVPAITTAAASSAVAGLHQTSLLWGGEDQLASSRDRLTARLEAIYQTRAPQLSDVATWAATRSSTLDLGLLWGRPPPAGAGRVEVARTYTRTVWETGVGRLASDLEGTPVDLQARTFAADYLRAYAAAWQDFLSGFHLGALAWSDDLPALVALLGDEGSPYAKLWRTLGDQLFPLSGQTAMPRWPQALMQTLESPWPEVEPKLRMLFFELNEDRSGARAYQLASAIYGAGAPPDPTVAIFREVQAALEAPPAEGEPLSIDGQRAWRVIRQPLSLWLRIVNQRAGAYLDQIWREQVVDAVAAQPERQRQAFLFGSQGRVAAFRDLWLRPLLAETGAAAQLGVAPPIADEFQAFLEGAAAGQGNGGPIYAGRLSIGEPPQFGPFTAEPGGMSFTLSCLSGNQAASDASPQQAVLTLAWSPDTCFDVSIALRLPALLAADGGSPGMLVRTYAGPEGFLKFIADFRGGPRTMGIGEFSVPPATRATLSAYGVTRITVPIQLELSESMLAWLEQPASIQLPTRVSASAFAPSSATDRLQ